MSMCRHTRVRSWVATLAWLVAPVVAASGTPAGAVPIGWRVAGDLPSEQRRDLPLGIGGPVVGVSHGQLIVGGGANFPGGPPWRGGHKVFYKRICAFRIDGNRLRHAPSCATLPYGVAYSANVSTRDGVVAVGGENSQGPSSGVLLIRWNAGLDRLDISRLPNLPLALTDGMAAAVDGTVYFAGGAHGWTASNKLYALDLSDVNAGWQVIGRLPERVRDGVLLATTGQSADALYLVGGRRSTKSGVSALYSSVYRYDLAHKSWSRRASLPYVLSAETGVAWGTHTLLIFSGDRGGTFHQTQVLAAEVRAAKNPGIKRQLRIQLAIVQEMHPAYSRAVLRYDTTSNQWTRVGTLPYYGQVTTTAVKRGREVWIPSGEIRAGVRTPQIIVGTLPTSWTASSVHQIP